MEEEETKLIWNFDDAESKLIFHMKYEFVQYRDAWDLENAYWSLLRLLSEIEPLFDEIEREELNEGFDEISKKRQEHKGFLNLNDNNKGNSFILLNDFYRKLCSEIVDKDFYFRKKKGYTGL
jgi:hypothetical protein